MNKSINTFDKGGVKGYNWKNNVIYSQKYIVENIFLSEIDKKFTNLLTGGVKKEVVYMLIIKCPQCGAKSDKVIANLNVVVRFDLDANGSPREVVDTTIGIKEKVQNLHEAKVTHYVCNTCGHEWEPPKILDRPYTWYEIQRYGGLSGNNKITGVIQMDLHGISKITHECFLDIISVLLTETNLLTDISFKLIGYDEDVLYIEVSGNVEKVLKEYNQGRCASF